jgi:hypothetical protein
LIVEGAGRERASTQRSPHIGGRTGWEHGDAVRPAERYELTMLAIPQELALTSRGGGSLDVAAAAEPKVGMADHLIFERGV